MKKQLNIYGEQFTLCGTCERSIESISGLDIYDVYGRPSDRKVSIWHSWANWFLNEARTARFGICSHNCNFFSIEGIVEFEGKWYYLWITKTYNRAYEIVMS